MFACLFYVVVVVVVFVVVLTGAIFIFSPIDLDLWCSAVLLSMDRLILVGVEAAVEEEVSAVVGEDLTSQSKSGAK